MTRGRYLVLEGGEGVGKSTQVARLAARLAHRGIEVRTLREPGGDPFAEAGRALLLGDTPRAPEAEVLLFNALRAQLIVDVVRPLLEAGVWVLSDRSRLSTIAYQGYGHGVDLAWTRDVCALVGQLATPDLEIVLEVDPDEADRRRRARGISDRFEELDDAFHRRVTNGYGREARIQGLPVIDGGGSEVDVEDRLWAQVEGLLDLA